jgi:hypothetical protein
MAMSLEQRIHALEKQIAALLQKQETSGNNSRAWLDDLYGKFAGDPIFARAMKLGQDYRKSLGPRPRKTKPES